MDEEERQVDDKIFELATSSLFDQIVTRIKEKSLKLPIVLFKTKSGNKVEWRSFTGNLDIKIAEKVLNDHLRMLEEEDDLEFVCFTSFGSSKKDLGKVTFPDRKDVIISEIREHLGRRTVKVQNVTIDDNDEIVSFGEDIYEELNFKFSVLSGIFGF